MLTEYQEVGGEYDNEQQEPLERIETEQSPVDYVYWHDFAHLPARTWDEVTWVARRVYLTKEEGMARFGDDFASVPLTTSPDKLNEEKSTTEELKKAEVWEIWCKTSEKVYWVAKNFDTILDVRDDPLNLVNFFPCPKPYYATLTTNSLVPIADFLMYQDQANEIDDITSRIQHLTRALKVMGIYAADEPAIERLMKEGNDAVMIPVKNWSAFVEKGGLNQAIQFIPLKDVASTLQQLYTAREACKQIIYETTGLSDIIRGASQAQETATAQQIKSQFASLRLNDMKDDMARFARDILRMKAEIMCEKYQPETLIKSSGIMHTSDAGLVQQALALLKDSSMRDFNIDIQTDTLVLIDEQTDKQNRMEFLQAASGFLQQIAQLGQEMPEAVPLAGEMMLFGIRGFKVGRSIEAAFEQFINIEKQKASQPKPPPPEQQKMQIEMQAKQADMQIEQQKMQSDLQLKQADYQLEQQKLNADLELERQKLQLEQWKVQLDNDTKVLIAQMQAQNSMKQKEMDINVQNKNIIDESIENGEVAPMNSLSSLIDAVNNNMMAIMQHHTNNTNAMLQQLTRKKNVIRDESGKVIGVE